MTTATIKTLLVVVVFIIGTIFPLHGTETFQVTLWMSIAAFIIGLVLTHILLKNSLLNRLEIKKPKWTESITEKNPLTYTQLIGFILLAAGLGGLFGGLIEGQVTNFIGTILFVAGIGTILGMYLELRAKSKTQNEI